MQLPLLGSNEINNSLRLSVSRVKVWDQCKAQYHFTYILKLPQKEQAHHVLGKAVHMILELFHLDYLNGTKEPKNKVMSRAYKSAFEKYGSKITNDMRKEIYQIIDSYLKGLSEKRITINNILSVEKHFNIPISNNVSLNGMIDRIQRDEDGMLHICDYKSTKNKRYLKDDFLQLLTYAYTLFVEDPSLEKVRGSYILLRHNFEYLTKVFNKDEIIQIKDMYDNYAKQIEQEKDWAPTTSKLCNYCSFLDKCDAGKEFMVKDIKFGQVNWR
jgi:putative RecB family exonuclease